MSVTESKAKTERKSSRKPAKTQETVLSALLAQTEEVSVPLTTLTARNRCRKKRQWRKSVCHY